MKTGIHPKVHKGIIATCSCGASFTFDSTAEIIKTEVCSACHPFYTGKQKLVDTAGKVDKFRAKMEAAKAANSSKKKGKISENVKAAAAASSRGDAIASAKAVKKVKSAVQKREIAKQKIVDSKQDAEQETGESKKVEKVESIEDAKKTEKKSE